MRKNLLLATFRKQNFCNFVPRISLFCRLHTLGFLTSDAILTLFYCRRSNTNKKKKASKKGPRKRERERVWENRTSSIVVIVVPFHHRARRRRRAYIWICGKKLVGSSKRRFDLTRHENHPSSSKNHHDVLCFCARQRRLWKRRLRR